jgi:dihydroxyacetone kinase DhaKLM complex PTS-EIIA-like component DhaM
VKIFAAGGLDAETIGTNVETVLQILTEADNPDGTLVLMDLGSAILSAEAALELLPLEMQPRVCFCAAPLVEGAIAAAVQASLGSDLETVHREALHALDPKTEQLAEAILMGNRLSRRPEIHEGKSPDAVESSGCTPLGCPPGSVLHLGRDRTDVSNGRASICVLGASTTLAL